MWSPLRTKPVYNSDTGGYEPPVPAPKTLEGPATDFTAPYVAADVSVTNLRFNAAANTWTGTYLLNPNHGVSPYQVYWPNAGNGTPYATKV